MNLLEGATLRPYGEAAFVVEFGDTIDPATHDRVLALDAALTATVVAGVDEWVPSYRSVLVRLDTSGPAPQDVARALAALPSGPAQGSQRTHDVPVSFAPTDAPDLEAVAALTGLTADAVRAVLVATPLRVYLHGFAPGFAYLGGLPDGLAPPRRLTPRPPVPAGSVLLAAGQVALCPSPMPTGWWVVGRTDVTLFDPSATPPVPASPGDVVRLRAVQP